MTNSDDEYVVEFSSHGDEHEVSIGLECFANALKPYLSKPSRFQPPEKKECECEELRKSNCGCWVGLHPCSLHFCIHSLKLSPNLFACTKCGKGPGACLCHTEPECNFAHGVCVICFKCVVCEKCLCKPKPDEVDEKIEEITRKISSWANSYLENHLRELVDLVKKTYANNHNIRKWLP